MTALGHNPWWHPTSDDLDWDNSLPRVIVLVALFA